MFKLRCGCCRESVAINSSLMTLGRCLEALRWNQQHKNANLKVVPYRESKVGSMCDSLRGSACCSILGRMLYDVELICPLFQEIAS